MRNRLGASFPHVHPAVPVALATAAVLVAGTGASAVTMRGADRQAHHLRTVAAPAAKAPLTHLSLPAAPASASLPDAVASSTVTPPAPAVATVPRPRRLVAATLLVTSGRTLSAHQLQAIRALPGVAHVQVESGGTARIDGHKGFVLGVDPASFRPWTPYLTAASQPLWQSIAAGEMTASFDMGHDAQLPLGQSVFVRSKRGATIRLGAFASVGMAGVDAVVSSSRAAELGIVRGSAVLVSAPSADLLALRSQVRAIVGRYGYASLLREMVVIRDSGEFLTRAQINTVLQAAASRVGVPYVWGATGPDSFDCSGLVLWSFAKAGIRMPRVSQQQWFAGPHVPYSAARPGDLLFWHYDPTDPTNIDHVAIYAGNGMMLVAPHTGDFVKYVPVPLNNLAGVVRVDPSVASQI
ncbi:MAG: peptidoglycan DL-endopeptidase CwlO [Frankiaceae bacterium]|nr:peptidoglycan DL-endopeptidase CwlO [Frankiaceae bacterium]